MNIDSYKELIPDDFDAGSRQKLWWKCDYGHEWQATVLDRVKNHGCPYCSKNKLEKQTLLITNPELASQWHPEKNRIAIDKVTHGSHKKVWWICDKGHEWEAEIASRSRGSGCPYCSGKIVYAGNNLTVLDREISEEWHPTKNGELTPYDVTAGSNRKVWWICEHGHEWQARIDSRTNGGNGCPYCRRKGS